MDPVMQAPSGRTDHTTRDWGAIVFGIVLVAVGICFVLKETLQIALPEISWSSAWPLMVVGVGLLVLVRALTGWDRRTIRRGF